MILRRIALTRGDVSHTGRQRPKARAGARGFATLRRAHRPMNYRHHFHAGNAADVLKHLILVQLLRRLAEKPGGYCYLETHAGRGLYDLAGDPAQRSPEYLHGVSRLWQFTPDEPLLRDYMEQVRAHNPAAAGAPQRLRYYPGSPALARGLLRPQDRMVLCELHPEEHRALRGELAADPQVAIHRMDGYQGLRAFLPPPERRGLVLIDPPYERPDEFDVVLAAVRLAHQRFPTGLFALWYPIKAGAHLRAFRAAVVAAQIPKVLAVELVPTPEAQTDRLAGSGLLLINPPYRLDDALRRSLPLTLQRLDFREEGRDAGRWSVDWWTTERSPLRSPR
jgi:23S rRNA (adenine2030-N6)-methyltransferase